MSFHERFKTKFSKVSKQGELKINSESAITKPAQSQIHSPVYRQIANSVMNSHHKVHSSHKSSNSKPTQFKPMYSRSPPLALKNKYFPQFPITNNYENFEPYSLRDYNLIKPKKYYVLGGAGPVHVGSVEWTEKMQFLTKRNQYGKEVNKSNLRRVCKSTDFYSEKNSDLIMQKKLGYIQSLTEDDCL